jgi:hypothetical protein
MVPKNALQIVLAIFWGVLVILTTLVVKHAPGFDQTPSWLAPLLLVGAFVLLVVLVVRAGRLIERADAAWAETHGFVRSDQPFDLARGLSVSSYRGWTTVVDSKAFAGTYRHRDVTVYRHVAAQGAREARSVRSRSTMAVTQISAPMPLVEVSRGAGGTPTAAFGQWGKTKTGGTIPHGVTVRAEDDSYGAEVAMVVSGLASFQSLPSVTVALDGTRVVAWTRSGNRDVLLALVCDVADALPSALVEHYSVR